MSVLCYDSLSLGVMLNKRSCNLHESKWRDGVKEGDIVEVSVLRQAWHPSLVRAVQKQGRHAVLVVEPVFLGYTISVPLYSFKVRSPQIEHCELQSLLDMGLAFDDFNKHEAAHPAYHPFGNLKSPGAVQPAQRVYARASGGVCWVVQAPCTLPERTWLVRETSGALRFCLECDLVPTHMSPVAPVQTRRAKLGVVKVPLWVPSDDREKQDQAFAVALADTVKDHIRHGDDKLAVRLLKTHQDPLLTLCAFDEEKEQLARALCHAAHEPFGVNRVCSAVWQHGYGGKDYFVTADLNSVHESLKAIMANHRLHNLNIQELIQLDVRVNMWRMYKQWWGRANDLRLALERVQPVEVALSPESLRDGRDGNSITFDVHVNYAQETLYEDTKGSERLQRVDAVILDHFTPYALGSHPTQDPPLDERATPPGGVSNSGAPGESWKPMLRRLCDRKDSLVEAVLHREKLPCSTLQHCLARKIECEGGALFWNLCEGVVERLIVDSQVDAEPEELFVMQNPPQVRRQGGVLVHDNALDKMNCVVDIVKTERQRPGPVDRGSTLIYTAPALLYDWQRRMAQSGIDSHVFHGVGRRGPAAVEAMNRGDVIIASWAALHSHDDNYFLAHSDTPLWRIFVDEFDVSHSAFAPEIMKFQSASTWLLARNSDTHTLCLALPLLGIRPFAHRSGWAQNSLLSCLHRRHTHSLVHHKQQRNVRDALATLCRHVFLRQSSSAPTALVLQRQNHACTASYGENHAKIMRSFGRKLLNRRTPLELECSSNLANLSKRINLMCWGVMPPLHLIADRIGFGRYDTDPERHLRAMARAAEAQNRQQEEAHKEARLLVQQLRDRKTVQGRCPICFEDLCESADGGRLSQTVVVGQCGHVACGECADSIMRTATENRQNGNNDYGPTAPINHACCPICRHSWSNPDGRPLMISTGSTAPLRNVDGAVYNAECDAPTQNLAEKNPLIKTLQHLFSSFVPKESFVEHETAYYKPNRVVVVCRSQELVSHLYDHAICCTYQRFKITCATTPKARGKALAAFAKDDDRVKCAAVKYIFVTASLVRGMVFERTKHYVVVEELKSKETEDLKFAMHASLLTLPPEERHDPVKVHTIVAPLCPARRHGGVARIAPTAMILAARAGVVPTQPANSGGEYISRVRTFFGWPPPEISRARETAVVHPEPQAEAGPRILDSSDEETDEEPDEEPDEESDAFLTPRDIEALTVLLENQPTTLLIPELGGRIRVSGSARI